MCHRHRYFALLCFSFQAMIASSRPALAQDLLNDNLTSSSFNLALRPYATLPASDNSIVEMTTRAGSIGICRLPRRQFVVLNVIAGLDVEL
jgi:hypothetical protein